MPNSLVKSLAKKNNLSIDKVEDLWNDVEKEVKKTGLSSSSKNYYPLIVFLLKKKIKKLKINIQDASLCNNELLK